MSEGYGACCPVLLNEQLTDDVRFRTTAGVPTSNVSPLHKASRQDMLQEAADKLGDVEACSPWADTAGFAVCKRDGMVFEADETTGGEGHFKAIGGKGLQRNRAMGVGLPVHVPGHVPDVGSDLLLQSGLGHLRFEDGAVDGRQGLDGDVEGGS